MQGEQERSRGNASAAARLVRGYYVAIVLRWRLIGAGDKLTATALGAVKLEGVDPVAAC